jgi:hypothetical protein
MADSHHPPQPCPDAPAVRHDHGGWISGPSITTEYVAAGDLKPGDQILYGGLVAEVAAWPIAADWREAGEHMYGVEIECADAGGTGRLFLYRRRDHQFERIVEPGFAKRLGESGDDVELCPQAKVPCEPNAFDMCRYCGRDLSGNPS